MKPLQAAVSLKAIVEPMPDREVAVMCASHNGEPVHVGAVQAVLKRAGLGADALRNPAGWPLDPEAMAASHHPHRLLQNCSGKHAGMLLACVRAGWDPRPISGPGHPLQRRVRRAVLAATGLDDVEMGVDGCGVPVHGMPLRSMATLFARLSAPERLGELGSSAVEGRRGDAGRAIPGRRAPQLRHRGDARDRRRGRQARRRGPGVCGDPHVGPRASPSRSTTAGAAPARPR